MVVLMIQACSGEDEFKSVLMSKIWGNAKSDLEIQAIIQGYMASLSKEERDLEMAKLQEDIDDLRKAELELDSRN